MNIPFIGRLKAREYIAIVFGFLFLAIESFVRLFVTIILPKPILDWFYERSRSLFKQFVRQRSSPKTSPERQLVDKIRAAHDFADLCALRGYEFEEHLVLTRDGYLLGLHRLCTPKGTPRTSIGVSSNKPVVYLHHGLLMNSEIWVCLTTAERSLPFVLVDMGFDVWLGNNRGNKYSKKNIHLDPNSKEFWNYSMDDFAWHDIPDSVEYILDTTKSETLSYIGFSQGSAQAFAALSIRPQLNQKINVFIALAPAMSPAGLAAPVVDALMKASPTLMYLIFGRRAILSSAPMWNSILYPPLFCSVIDTSLQWLFNWKSKNISHEQKLAAYSHLYSFTSTKSIVHWFQIMRSGKFIMYDDDDIRVSGSSSRGASSGPTSYHPAKFPTKNISSPIVLLYGDIDSLVDIDVMVKELPADKVFVNRLVGYEHLDVIWGQNVDKDVIPTVVKTLIKYCENPRSVGGSGRSHGREDGTSTVVSD